jgi:hypothetical protein
VPPLPLGKLTVDHGQVNFLYKGDPQHSNLLGIVSSLLITEEDANNAPLRPSLDKRTWRYSAEIPQQPGTNGPNSLSALDYLRCLLYEQPDLERLGIHGGLAVQYLKNTEQVWRLAREASDAWGNQDPRSIQTLQNDVRQILLYIDGLSFLKQELPGKTGLSSVDPRAQVGLLTFQETFGSYYDSLYDRLTGVINSPGITSDMRMHATEARGGLIKVHDSLQQVHDYALKLATLSPAALLQPPVQAILKDMRRYAEYAYNGYIDPATGTAQPGVLQIDQDIQSLITFEIKQL